MKVLISGAGIAGLTQAYWLAKFGFDVTLIERSAHLRDEGYMMDFSAEGIQIVAAMGILDDLYDASAKLESLTFVSSTGRRQGGFKISVLQQLMTEQKSGYMPLMRGDLERTLADVLPSNVDIRIATTIASTTEKFDILIVAEGIHSPTRAKVFGAEEAFIHPLNSIVAIARLKDGGSALNGLVKTNINVGNFVIATPTVDGDIISVYAFASDANPPRDQNEAKAMLRAQFPKSNQFAQHYLSQITPDTDLFIDRVAQIHSPNWSRGRVAMIGDAASCMTLLSGQGSFMAMTQAYVLAHELAQCDGDYTEAFSKYDAVLRADVEDRMNVAAKVSVLIPTSKFQLFLFKIMARLMRRKYALRWLFGSYLKPTIFNKGYPIEGFQTEQRKAA